MDTISRSTRNGKNDGKSERKPIRLTYSSITCGRAPVTQIGVSPRANKLWMRRPHSCNRGFFGVFATSPW
ncbi:hypothetical protein JTE90_028571 [Oedothorax gibbosus]|uniref:Uncharacterized protein n=1 Tax=Oedothorax gibbosus TaxID=931172 RepID=A0AAV6VXD8_9ARAC|nr:hypothetical protein JTE90_028571 [Oedothorax gibbosus]